MTNCIGVSVRVLATATTVLVMGAAPASAQVRWQSPQSLGQGVFLSDVTCSSSARCVAVGGPTIAVSSSENAGGRVWDSVTSIGPGADFLGAVSCPDDTHCVAVGGYGVGDPALDQVGGLTAWSSSNPAAGASGWSRTEVGGPAPTAIDGVSCPSTNLCVAVNYHSVLVSNNPFSASPAWTARELAGLPPGSLTGIACPSERLCVTVSTGGAIMTSTAPADPVAPWSLTPAPTGTRSVACPSESLCVAMGAEDVVMASVDPASRLWNRLSIPGQVAVNDVSCATEMRCAATAIRGRVLSTRHPAAPLEWSLSEISESSADPQAIACYAADYCVAVDDAGRAMTGAPAAGGADWTDPTTISSSPTGGARLALAAVSCASSQFCAAYSTDDPSVIAGNPTAGPRSFRTAATLRIGEPNGTPVISCPRPSFCAMAMGNRFFRSSNPSGGVGTWSRTLIRAPRGFNARDLTCVDARLCIAVGSRGAQARSTDAGRSWAAQGADRPSDFTAISCPSSRLCVAAGGSGGRIGILRNPAGAHSRWQVARLGGGLVFSGISCPTVSLCIALDARGRIVTSTRPTRGPAAWRMRGTVSNFTRASRISCPTVRFCAAVSETGAVIHSENPTGPHRAWTLTEVFLPARNAASVSCATARSCVVVYGDQLATLIIRAR